MVVFVENSGAVLCDSEGDPDYLFLVGQFSKRIDCFQQMERELQAIYDYYELW